MAVTAAQVKELRERTGAGMMECKKALESVHGDMQQAVEELRKSGRAKADKKAGRIAAEGLVIIRAAETGKQAIMLEINCETDFVARDENFLTFANSIAEVALANKVKDLATLNTITLGSVSIEEARKALVAKIGENIHIRRLAFMDSANSIGTYLHGNRIGVLIELDSDQGALAKDIAMHVAALRPLVLEPKDVASSLVQKEKEIYMAQAADSGKPQDIIEKMVGGRLKKFLDEISLIGQPFVKDPDVSIGNLLEKHRAKVLAFTRFEVGEGIEKETEDFVEAVMSQVKGD